ncbi:hypothetical protein D3C87_1626760 [compost metagenome]
MAVTLGQQGGETGNAQVLDPGEIGFSRSVHVGTVESGGELDARHAGLLGQFHQHAGAGDVPTFDIKRMLNQPEQLPGTIRRQSARRH